MIKKNSFRSAEILLLVLLLTGPSAHGFVTHLAYNSTDPDLDGCFDRLRSIAQSEQDVSFVTYSGVQSTGVSSTEIYWKELAQDDSRILIRVQDPPARRGVSLLILQQDQAPPGLHMYLPELRSVRRITGNTLKGTLLGTDFNYEDFLHLYGLTAAATLERKEDEQVSSRKVFVTDVVPDDQNSSYSKIKSFVDQQWCVPLKIDFYNQDGELRKTMTVSPDDVSEISGYRIPTKFEMHDIEQDTRTAVTIESMTINEPIRDSVFSLSNLRSGR